MKRIPKDTLIKLKSLDLLTYFQTYYPDELINNGRNDYKTFTHSSLHLSNGMWYYWKKGIGGKSALDYLIKVEEYSFKDAVNHLLNLTKGNLPEPIKQEPRVQVRFQLPKKNYNNDLIIDYLCNQRLIDREVVDYCIDKNIIYESKFDHSVVFVGYDEFNVPKFATKRAIDSPAKKDILGSHKNYSFSITNTQSQILHVFEASIDLLSYMTILKNRNKDYLEDSYLALSGVSGLQSIALDEYLKKHHNIKEIALHLDNDDAGRRATNAIIDSYGVVYYVEEQSPAKGKDVNEYLKILTESNSFIPAKQKKIHVKEVR